MIFSTSRIEISRSALKHNLQFIRDNLKEGVVFSSVVKGNAYGHGIEHFVPLAEESDVRHFSVFSTDEAYRVHKVCKHDSTIMIMGMMGNGELEWAIENDIEFYVFDIERLERAARVGRKLNKKARIHIELETGMNRIGLMPRDLKRAIQIINNNSDSIEFIGFCTHYAGSESIANYYRVQRQYKVFNRATKKLREKQVVPLMLHTASSAASLRYPKTQMDLARIGILQYGFFPSREVMIDYLTKRKEKEYPLERVITWKSKVMHIKKVKAGEFVGYGTSYLANTDLVVAVVPVGYGHGFSRALSNTGRALIHGHRVSVIGTVNMNAVTLDVTNIESVQKGDDVVFIGRQGNLEISVTAFGEFSTQINYELLTRLPESIQRYVVD